MSKAQTTHPNRLEWLADDVIGPPINQKKIKTFVRAAISLHKEGRIDEQTLYEALAFYLSYYIGDKVESEIDSLFNNRIRHFFEKSPSF